MISLILESNIRHKSTFSHDRSRPTDREQTGGYQGEKGWGTIN